MSELLPEAEWFDTLKGAVWDSQMFDTRVLSMVPQLIARLRPQTQGDLQASTVLLIVLYTIWSDITGRLFEYLQCEPYRLYEGGQVQEQLVGRWMLHPDVRCDEEPFWQIMLCASCGLVLWSFGIPVVIFIVISRLGKKRFTPEYIGYYGFFYQGFEPSYWYWDLTVKRFDVFAMTAVAHTNIVPDVRAKLLWYMLQSGIMLALHNFCKPLDERRAGLLDFIESFALSVRSPDSVSTRTC